MTVRAYPWSTLERVPRRALRRLTDLREHPAAFVPEELAGVLTVLVGTPIEVEMSGLGLDAPAKRTTEVALAWGESVVTLGMEPALATALLQHLLARPLSVPSLDAPLEPSIAGALAALALEVARRLTREPVTLAEPDATPPDTLCVRANVRVNDRSYAAYAIVSLARVPTRGSAAPGLDALGDLPLAIPLVVAISLARRAELRQLAPGSAFVPGESAWVDAEGKGRGILAAATSERGVWVDMPPDGRLVLRGDIAELSPDLADAGQSMSEPDDVNQTLTDAALDAPIVVRVELGAVSMSASDWAKLRSGDVIETGRRVAEPVLLRVAGRVVARGELVDVNGEVGVRVRDLLGGKPER